MDNTFTFIDDTKTILVRDLQALYEELESTPEQHLWLTIPGVLNSVGTLSHHICGNLKHFIGAKLGNDGYVRNRDDEFENKGLSKEELLAEIRATISAVQIALEGMNEQRLHDKMPDPPPQHEGRSVGFFLIQLCCHLSRHRGQLNYIRRVLSAENEKSA